MLHYQILSDPGILSGLWEVFLAKWVWTFVERTEHSINLNCNFLQLCWLGRVDTMKPSTQSKDSSLLPPHRELKKQIASRLSIDPTWRTRNCSTMEGKINIIILILLTVTWRHSMDDTDSTTSLSGSTHKSSLATSEKQVKKHKISIKECADMPCVNWVTD